MNLEQWTHPSPGLSGGKSRCWRQVAVFLPCLLWLSSLPAQTPLIIGGTNSLPSDYPAVGAVLILLHYPSYDYPVLGSGTFIAPDVVLSAAHVLETDPQATSIDRYFSRALDVTDFYNQMTLPPDAVRFTSVVVPPGWNPPPNHGPYYWDVGLGFLETPITSVEPAALMTPADSGWLQPGAPIEIIGYGLSRSLNVDPAGATAGVKRQTSTIIQDVQPLPIDIGTPTGSPCEGDSGGPGLMVISDGLAPALRVVSVASAGDVNCDNVAEMRIDAYWQWIDQQMRQACAQGKRASGQCLDGGGIPPLRALRLSIQPSLAVGSSAAGTVLSWNTVSGNFYNVIGSTNLAAPWAPLLSAPFQASNSQTFWTNRSAQPARFYRIVELGSP